MHYIRSTKVSQNSFFEEISVKSTSLAFHTFEAVNIRSPYNTEIHDLMRKPESNLIRHITNITIPDSEGVYRYRYRASGYRFGRITYAMHYSDEIAGISGGGNRQSGIIAKFLLSGELRLENGKDSVAVKPGQACMFDTRKPWKFWKSNNTRYRWIMIPDSYVYGNVKGLNLADRPVIVENTKPEARMAISFLDMLKSQHLQGLTTSGQASTEEAASWLLSSVVSSAAPLVSSREFGNLTVAVAQKFIDENLASFDLNPASIARAISVSPRTLHRAFSSAGISVMGYTRMRRIQEACKDLSLYGNDVSVSSIASKWGFSDASHFIRHFKEVYGVTPISYVRSLRASEKP